MRTPLPYELNLAGARAAMSYYEHGYLYGLGLDAVEELDPETAASKLMMFPAALRGASPAPEALNAEQREILTPYVAAGIRSAQYVMEEKRQALHREFHATVQQHLRAGNVPYAELAERRGDHEGAHVQRALLRDRGLAA